MNDTQSDILIELVATVDAIHEPIRAHRWGAPRPAVVWEQRRQYREGGVDWASERLTAAGRKDSQRGLESVADAGLVKVIRARGRTAQVRLTDRGEAIGRRLTADFTSIDFAIVRMRDLAKLTGKAGTTRDGFAPEPMLCGTQWGAPDATDKLSELQLDLLPALARGWVESTTSIQGHCWYRLSADGRGVAGGNVDVPTFDDLPPMPEDDADVQAAHDRYADAVSAARARLDGLKPSHAGEIGCIPCPVSMPGLILPDDVDLDALAAEEVAKAHGGES